MDYNCPGDQEILKQRRLRPFMDLSGGAWSLSHSLFYEEVLDRYPHLTVLRWGKALEVPDFPGDLLLRYENEEGDVAGVHRLRDGILVYQSEGPRGRSDSTVTIAALTPNILDSYRDQIAPLLPVAETIEGKVGITFWTQGTHSNIAWPRSMDVPSWKEISANYPETTRGAINELVNEFRPDSGKLILWHGEPGTGKTWALRSLLGEWKKWCRPQFIVDPEKLFGSDSAYLLQVLLQEDRDHADDLDAWIASRPGEVAVNESMTGWRLLILEDTGELLSQDAKERSGQGLSRLLNVTDGLIGQGLKLLVLITTNEPLSKLHPAVSRPGRTAAEIEFATFTSPEAEVWLDKHGINAMGTLSGSHTLAELYARVSGRRLKRRTQQKVGFS